MAYLDQLLSTPINIDVDGIGYRGQTLTQVQAAGVPVAALLVAAQSYLKGKVDDTAEALRSRVITRGSGQALEYQEVQAQAVAATAAGASATAEQFPMLAATIGIDVDPETKAPAADVLGVARSVIAAYSAWTEIGSAIRGARLKGKAAIDSAATIEAAAAAYDAIAWPALPA